MKFPITVREVRECFFIIESDSYEEAVEYVRKAYNEGKIEMDKNCIIPVPTTGEYAEYGEAGFINPYELPEMDVDVL